MADAVVINAETPRISRTGRVLRKPLKLRQLEETDYVRLMKNKTGMQIRRRMEDRLITTKILQKQPVNEEKFLQGSLNTEVTKRARKASSRYSVMKSTAALFSDTGKVESCAAWKSNTYLSEESDLNVTDLPSSISESSDTEADSGDGRKKSRDFEEHSICSTSFIEESSFDGSDSVLVTDDDSGTPLKDKKIGSRSYENDPDYVFQSCKSTKSITVSAIKKKANTTENSNVPEAKRFTSFMLWFSRNKWRIKTSHKDLKHRGLLKKAGELWRALPENEKALWKRKAMQFTLKNCSISSTQKRNTTSASTYTSLIDEHEYLLPKEKASLGCRPIDAAAHLTLLGNSLISTGCKLFEMDCRLDANGVYSALLDVLLCSVAPLLCLTREIAGLEYLQEDVFLRMLDHISYFIPNI